MNFYKLSLNLLISLFLHSCVSPGTKIFNYDEYKGVRSELLSLGSVKNINSTGLINQITISIGKDSDKYSKYFFALDSYSEGSGRDCPIAERGSEVIVISSKHKFNYNIVDNSNIYEMKPGLLSFACSEKNIKFGYIDIKDLKIMLNQNNIKFKIYSKKFSIEARLSDKQLKLINDFIAEK